MLTKIKNNKFLETFGFMKNVIKNIFNDREKIFKYMIYIFIFLFISGILTAFGDNFNMETLNTLKPEAVENANPMQFVENQNLFVILLNVFNSFISFFLFCIMSMAFLFFRESPKTFNKNLLHVFSFGFYVNFLLTILVMIIFYVIVLTLCMPDSLANFDIANAGNNAQLELEKIIEGFLTPDYVKIIIGCSLFIISFPFFILTTLISYMNVLDQKESIFKTYFYTLKGVSKNYFFWFIPFTLYFLFAMVAHYFLKIETNPTEIEYLKLFLNSLLGSFLLGVGGYILYSLKEQIFPEDKFNPVDEEKERIMKKYKKK